MAGYMMERHSWSVRDEQAMGYFNFAEIVIFNAVNASFCDGLPSLILLAHIKALFFRTETSFVLFPLGAIQIPNISAASSAWSRLRLTSSPDGAVAYKSKSSLTSAAIHLP